MKFKALLLFMILTTTTANKGSQSYTSQYSVALPLCKCDMSTTSMHLNVQRPRGIPGKRGPRGMKGEKGEPFGIVRQEQLESEVSGLESRLDNDQIQLRYQQSEMEKMATTLNKFLELLSISQDENEKLQSQMQLMEEQLKDLTKVMEAYKTDVKDQIVRLINEIGRSNRIRSCQDILRFSKNAVNGSYTIEPEAGVNPFTVDCLFNGNTAITSISHDSQEEIEVLPKCELPNCYQHTLRYNASYTQMKSLIKRSEKCWQFVKYRCIDSVIEFGGWSSWDGRMHHYWGDVDQDCECGKTGDCYNPSWKCNCDENAADVELEDSGYLSKKEDLPLHSIYFGDTFDEGEHGYHTVGPLQCIG